MGFLSRFLRGDDDEKGSESAEARTPRDERGEPGAPIDAPAPPTWDFGALAAAPVAADPAGVPSFVADPVVTAEVKPRAIEAIKTVFDPEIPVDIYELGLIYGIEADAQRHVRIAMTLTSPACPSAQQLPSEVRFKVKAIEGVSDATVDVVWEPPWDKDKMSDVAKLSLGMF